MLQFLAAAAPFISSVGQWYANQQSASSARRAARPYVKAGRWALPQLQASAAEDQGRALQGSQLLTAEHGENLRGISRNADRALAMASENYADTGNLGMARGESLRIKRTGVETTNRENLNYGATQEAYKQSARDAFRSSLSGLINAGQYGTNMENQANRDYSDSWNQLLGDASGYAGMAQGNNMFSSMGAGAGGAASGGNPDAAAMQAISLPMTASGGTVDTPASSGSMLYDPAVTADFGWGAARKRRRNTNAYSLR